LAEPRTSFRSRVHRQLDPSAWHDGRLSPVNALLVLLILLATVAAIAETEPELYGPYGRWFDAAELFFGLVFLLEYVARFWSIAEDANGGSASARRLRFFLSPAALIDLAVVVATLVPFVLVNPAMLRLVRLLRIARLAKLGRMSVALHQVSHAIWLRRYELGLTLALAVAVLIVGATALYWLEGELQPDKFGSIPRALWWAVVTLTTIGYGDVYPISVGGKIAASFLAIAGVGLIALPAGIMAGAMQEAMRREHADREV
jgi:voltage-gated potassium channel